MSEAAVAAEQGRLSEICKRELGRTPVRIEAVPAGLGTRRFHRIHFASGEPATLIARLEGEASTAPRTADRVPSAPALPAEPALEPLRSFLETHGVPVPRSYLSRPIDGLELLEDLGPSALGEARGEHPDPLYAEACAIVPRLQRLSASADRIPAFGRALDRAVIESKGWKLLHWTIPLLLERPASAGETSAIEQLFTRIADLVTAAPQRLSHRDYKAENLHRRANRELVLIDLQGAWLAPPEYDLVCLLYDLQVGPPEALVQAQFGRIREQLPDAPSADEAQQRFDALAVARLCKDVSHVVHAGLVRGDRRRFGEISTGLELLSRATGRIGHEFPGVETLDSVIQALTRRVQSADSQAGEE